MTTTTAKMEQVTAADGHTLDCWVQRATANKIGGIVIVQEIFGVTDQLKGVAAQYAALGYDVAIPALFDRQERDAVVPFDQGPRGRDMMLAADLGQTMADIDAAVAALQERGSKVAVIGFCWGGGLALRAAQKLDVAGAVAFYGTRLPQYLDSPLKAPFLGHFGDKDDHVPVEMLAEAQAYLPDMEVHLYDAGHAFANDARPSYVAKAAELAHARTQEFLTRVMV
jgi:carboxymethylenebutenolidase